MWDTARFMIKGEVCVKVYKAKKVSSGQWDDEMFILEALVKNP